MKIKAYNFLIHVIFFSSTSFIISMDPATESQSLSDRLKHDYTEKALKLKEKNLSSEEINNIYYEIETMVKKYPDEKYKLLTMPLDKTEISLIHLVAQLSRQIPDELSNKKLSTLKTLYQFFNFLFQNNVPINIQDTHGNTPLLYAFEEKEADGQIAWCPEIVFLLLHYQAHPLIKNNKGTNPKDYLEKILQKRYTSHYESNNVVYEMHLNLIEQALYHYK